MVDYAARLLNVLSAAPATRADLVRRLSAQYDANSDGKVGTDEFRRMFAEAQLDSAALPEVGSGSSFGVRRTLYAATLYPSFSRNYAQASYQAQEMVSALDVDGDGQVSASEFDGTASPPAQTPDARADALLARYDAEAKGYIVESDVAAVWAKDPSLGDATLAGQAIAVFDLDGDGKATRAEMVTGYEAMDKADAIMAVYDPNGTGAIDIANAANIVSPEFAGAAAKFSAWDVSGEGQLSRQELIAGLQYDAMTAASSSQPSSTDPTIDSTTDPALLAAMLMTKYDTNGDGAISSTEFATASAGADFTAWDSNADQSLSLEELQAGIVEIQQAKQIVSQYDLTNKGYFDIADLTAALDPATVDDVNARASEVMSFWDSDGNGRVTVQEVLSGVIAGGYVGGEQLNATDQGTPSSDPAA